MGKVANKYAFLFLCLLLCGWVQPVRAQTTVTEITPFSFGKFSVTDNTAQRDLIINAATGTVTPDAEFIIDIQPQRGEYRLEGFDPGTEVTVTVSDGGLTLNGGGGTEVFATVDYTVNPSPVITNGSGEIVFYIGATLRTRGDSITYATGTYSDDLDIQFDWVP